MAARGEQEEQPLAGLSAAPGAPLALDPETGGAEGEPSPWRPARARAVVAALVACAVLAALVAVGPRRIRAAARQVEVGPGALGSTVSLALSDQEYNEMLDGMNELRMKRGLSTLCYNEKLNKAAQLHADDLSESNYWSHVGSDGSKPADRIANVGYDAFTEGESLWGGEHVTPSDVLFSWSAHWNEQHNVFFPSFSHFGFARSGSVWVGLWALPEGKEACIQAGGGADGHGGLCRDFVPAGESSWHDSEGSPCTWYAIGNHCADHGHNYKNFNHTADTACCACGRVEGGGCMDLVPDGWKVWYDRYGSQCDYYGREGSDLCQTYGGHTPNGGLTARMACCVCGGGRTLGEDPTSDFLAPPPSSGLGCRRRCQDSAECHSTLFCCPRHHVCMDPVTLSPFGSNCDKIDQSNSA